jgi:hypothetical protein
LKAEHGLQLCRSLTGLQALAQGSSPAARRGEHAHLKAHQIDTSTANRSFWPLAKMGARVTCQQMTRSILLTRSDAAI